MSYVSAQTIACDRKSAGTPDNANQNQNEPAFTIAEKPLLLTFEPRTSDPGALAAKILQLSAASDNGPSPRAKEPKLRAKDDTPLEVPRVLSRQASFRNPERNPPSAKTHERGSAPSFRSLVVSTCLIALGAASVLVFDLAGLVSDGNLGDRSVPTQTIIVSGAPKGHASSEPGKQQIEKAKDRIRQAFAAGSNPLPQQPETSFRPSAKTSRSDHGTLKLASLNGSWPVRNPHPESIAFTKPPTLPPKTQMPDQNKTVVLGQDPQSYGPTTENPIDNDSGPKTTTLNTLDGVATASVNLRQTEDKNGRIIGVIPEGAKMQIGACGKWWCSVSYKGTDGFVGQKFVERPNPNE